MIPTKTMGCLIWLVFAGVLVGWIVSVASAETSARTVAVVAADERRSFIYEADGYGALGEQTTRAQVRELAFAQAKQRVLEKAETRISSETKVENLEVTSDIIFDRVSRAKALRRLVLLDACRERLSRNRAGGAEATSAMSRAFLQAMNQASGQVVLSAAPLEGYGSGCRTGMALIHCHTRRIRKVLQRARTGSIGAAAGTSTPGSAGRRIATSAPPATAAAASVAAC